MSSSTTNIISATKVSKSFGTFVAVNSLDLAVAPGECFGLLGPNGAGKSTLIKMIYGVTAKTSGELSVLGYDPGRDFRQLRQHIGVVMQEDALDEAMNVRENMIMFSHFHGKWGQDASSNVDSLLDYMGLTSKADSPIVALSGGMRRRLSFVRSLIPNPKLLILDEPTTGLDPAVRQLLWEKINDLKKKGTTILLTTHYMDEAEVLCSRIAIMDGGKIQAEDTPKNLIQQNSLGFVAIYLDPQDKSKHLRVEGQSLDDIASKVRALGVTPEVVRPSNLEDAFLKLTGKQLYV